MTVTTKPPVRGWSLIVDCLAELGRGELERRLAAEVTPDQESEFTGMMRDRRDAEPAAQQADETARSDDESQYDAQDGTGGA